MPQEISDDDEFVYTSEIVTKEQIDNLNALLSLPWIPGFELDWRDEEDARDYK